MIKSRAISGIIYASSEAILAANRSYQYHSLVILTVKIPRLGSRTQTITPPQSWTGHEQKALAWRHSIGVAPAPLGHHITPRPFSTKHLWRRRFTWVERKNCVFPTWVRKGRTPVIFPQSVPLQASIAQSPRHDGLAWDLKSFGRLHRSIFVSVSPDVGPVQSVHTHDSWRWATRAVFTCLSPPEGTSSTDTTKVTDTCNRWGVE